MPIVMSDLLDERHVILGLRSRKPANAIREVVRMLAHTGKIAKPEAFLEQVLTRDPIPPRKLASSPARIKSPLS